MAYPDAPYTWPCPPTDGLGPWRNRHLRLLARRVLDWPDPLPSWAAQAWHGVREPLARVLKESPAVFLGTLALPTVGAALGGGDLVGGMPHLLLELARRGVLPEQGIFWSAPVRALVSPALGAHRQFSPPRVGVLFQNGLVTVSPTEEWALSPEVEPRAWPLAHGAWLLGADTNPLAMFEAHPEKEGNGLDFGTATPAEWVAALDEARARIARFAPELAHEHAQVLGGVVPVGTHGERSFSASYKEAIGLVYVSLHKASVTMTEALVHEVQHSKLNLLAWSDRLIENSGELYKSPVRPDPRPLWGVLLAVHAFLPVARLHRAMLDAGAPEADPERYRAVCEKNHEGMEVLRAAARPTATGLSLVQGLDRLEAALWAEREAYGG